MGKCPGTPGHFLHAVVDKPMRFWDNGGVNEREVDRMNYTLAALDMDGTLLTSDHVTTP